MDLKRYLNSMTKISYMVLILGTLLIAASGIYIFFFNSTHKEIVILDPLDYKVGRWNLDYPLYVYHRNKGTLEFRENNLDGRYLSFSNNEEGAKVYNGFGFFGPFNIPSETSIQITWRVPEGTMPFLDVQLIDTEPANSGYETGEYFRHSIETPDKIWETDSFTIEDFKQNEWQNPRGFVDGILESSRIQKLEISLPPESRGVIDIKSIYVIDENPSFINLLFIALTLVFPLLLIIRTRAKLTPGKDSNNSIKLAVSRRLSILAGSLSLFLSILLSPEIFSQPHISASFMLLMGLLFISDIIPSGFQEKLVYNILWLVFFIPLYIYSPKLNPLVLGILVLIPLYTVFTLKKRFRYILLSILMIGAVAAKNIIKVDGNYIMQYFAVIVAVLSGITITELFISLSTRQDSLQSLNLYHGILAYSPDGIVTLDTQNRITGFNTGFRNWTGLDSQDIMERDLSQFISSEKELHNESLQSGDVLRYDATITSRDGTARNVYICRHPILSRGEIAGYQIIATDITERKIMELKLKEANKRLENLVNIDGLTQIYNRRFFDSQLEQEWRRGCRNNRPLSLILLDIDYFKLYNDTYGHIQGDECLKQVAKILKNNLKRAADFLGRYGGEEFVVILPYTDKDDAYHVAERLRMKIESSAIPHEKSEIAGVITVSLGVSTLFPDCRSGSANELLQNADEALYLSKEKGRNCSSIINSSKDL